MAWQVYASSLCDGCSQDRSESMAPGADDAYTAEAVRCFGCRAKERAAEGFESNTNSLYFVVKRTG